MLFAKIFNFSNSSPLIKFSCILPALLLKFLHNNMNERALQYFNSAFDIIKAGDFFNEEANHTFEYMVKSLWGSEFKDIIKAEIIKYLPAMYIQSKNGENPPPFLYILISLKDVDIVKELQSLSILNFIKENASEQSVFALTNFVETFAEKQIPIQSFVNTIIKHFNKGQNVDMQEALAYMISTHHPEFIKSFIKKFVDMKDENLLKNYIRMVGKRAMLELLQINNPNEVQKLLK